MSSTIPNTTAEHDRNRVVECPDGFWWQPLDGGREHGPFATLMEAVADMEASDEAPAEDAADALRDAEDVLGVPDWVDPETGRLADDERTRTEDH